MIDIKIILLLFACIFLAIAQTPAGNRLVPPKGIKNARGEKAASSALIGT